MKADQPTVAEIAEEILDYLKAHPQAADTLDGIADWWLIRSRYLRGLQQVKGAVELLVERGLVIERSQPDRSTLYCAASQAPLVGAPEHVED